MPETRIGAFDFSAAACTEPLWCGSADVQRACGDSWRGVTEDLFLFSQEDPIALPPSMTRYAYAINDPANFYDPNGQSAVGVVTRFAAVDLVTPDPTDVAIGPKIAFYATAVGGAIFIDYVFERSRAHSDPVRVPAWVDVGRDCQGRCRPCPTPPSPWQHPGNEHGSTSGSHWHWIEWHQDPSNCRCYSTRRDGPTAP